VVADITGAQHESILLCWTHFLLDLTVILLADQVKSIALLFLLITLLRNKLSRRILLLLGRGFALSENIVPQQQLLREA
jgi:hypothetical protein